MPPIKVTVSGVLKLLKGLNPKKAYGPDNIGPRLLRELSELFDSNSNLLRDRTQRVFLKVLHPTRFQLPLEYLRGSVLRPCLIQFYINDIAVGLQTVNCKIANW